MSSDNNQLFKSLLAEHGLHITRARLATFQLLVGAGPQTIRQILSNAKGQVDRVTIYRNIELFEKLGIVHRIYIGWKYKIELSDQFVAHHHHLSCLGCGKTIDIKDETHIDEFISKVAGDFNFEPKRHQFEIEGYCQDCLAP